MTQTDDLGDVLFFKTQPIASYGILFTKITGVNKMHQKEKRAREQDPLSKKTISFLFKCSRTIEMKQINN